MVFTQEFGRRKRRTVTTSVLGGCLLAVLVVAVSVAISTAVYAWFIMIGLGIAHGGAEAVPALGYEACLGFGLIATLLAYPATTAASRKS